MARRKSGKSPLARDMPDSAQPPHKALVQESGEEIEDDPLMRALLTEGDVPTQTPTRATVYDDDHYLRPKRPERKIGSGAKFQGALPDPSLYSVLDERTRNQIVAKAVNSIGVPRHLRDEARSEILFALCRMPVAGVKDRVAQAQSAAYRFAYKVKRDLGAPMKLSDDQFAGESRVKIYTSDSEDPSIDISHMEGGMELLSDTEHVAYSDPDLGAVSDAHREILAEAIDALGPKLKEFIQLLLQGESTARAADIQGISEQTAASYLKRVQDKVREIMADRGLSADDL